MSAGHNVGYEKFSDWERELAKRKAVEKARRLKSPNIDVDDLEQEFLLQLWIKRKAFDPGHESKSSQKTFMKQVLENRYRDIQRSEHMDKRSIHDQIDSLDREIEKEDGHSGTLGDLIAEVPISSMQSELKAVLEQAASALTNTQISIFRMVMKGHNLAEISRQTGTPWSSIKDEILRMREVLYDAGLHEFVSLRDLKKRRRIG